MTGLFEVLASDDSEGLVNRRVATRIANKRVTERYSSFIKGAATTAERLERLDLVRDEISDLVTATCNEYGVEPASITAAVLRTLAACECGKNNGNCTCDEEEDDKKEARTSSTKEARRPKVCPYHKEVMDISLAQGEPRAGFDAMAQHAWGPQHCQGNDFEGKCNFKREMVTQSYWDEKAEKAEERRQERQEQQVEQPHLEVVPDEAPESDVEPETETSDLAPAQDTESLSEGLSEAPSAIGEGNDAGAEAVPMGMAASVDDRLPLAERTASGPFHCSACGKEGTYDLGKGNPYRAVFAGNQCKFCGATGTNTKGPSPKTSADLPGYDAWKTQGPEGGKEECPECGEHTLDVDDFDQSVHCENCDYADGRDWDSEPGGHDYHSKVADQKKHLEGDKVTDKRQRQYEHIKDSCLEGGKSEEECKELAARTVNKQRAEKGETESKVAYGEPYSENELDRGVDEADSHRQEQEYQSLVQKYIAQGSSPEEAAALAGQEIYEQDSAYHERYDPPEADGPQHPTPFFQHSNTREAEALKTVDVDKDGEGPSPKMDKRKWTPENLEQRLDTEGEGSPHPTRQKDILDPADFAQDNRFEETDAVVEKQDVTKDSGPEPESSGTWADNGTNPVTSADVTKNPVREVLLEDDEFVPQTEVQAAVTAHKLR